MMKRLRNPLIFFIALILVACSNAETQGDISEGNALDTGTESVVERVVALSSLTADLTQQLSPAKLVGIPASSLLKDDERFTELPQVSRDRTPPNLEQIVALQPDLVLGAKGFHDTVAQRLEELGIGTKLVDVDSWSSLSQITEDLARRLGADPKGLLEQYQSCLAKAPSQGDSILVLVSRQPILSPNKKSWAGDFIQQFKAQNLAAEIQGDSPIGGYVTLSAETILQENPDMILIVDPGQQGILEQFQKDAFWSQLQASKNNRVYAVDYYGLVNPGSVAKIGEACDHLSEIIGNS